jgi:SOS-response transcriptional repressor LexA
MKLSRREEQTLEFITNSIRRSGRAPYQREICEHLGVSSRGFVGRLLSKLEAKGAIARVPYEIAGIVVHPIGAEKPAFLAQDVWLVVMEYAKASHATPHTVLAEWVRERAEYEARTAA